MHTYEILQRMKREWTPDKYTTKTYARDCDGLPTGIDSPEAAKFCTVGKILHITNGSARYGVVEPTYMGTTDAVAVMNMIEEKIREKGFGIRCPLTGDILNTIPHVNDSEGGYEKIMSIVDELLIEHAPELPPVEETVSERRGELVAV